MTAFLKANAAAVGWALKALAFLAFYVMLLGIAKQWTSVWVISPLVAIIAAMAVDPARKGELLRPRARWKLIAPVAFLWINLWVIAMLTPSDVNGIATTPTESHAGIGAWLSGGAHSVVFTIKSWWIYITTAQ
ncbi:MAG: hypothetical protein ABI643_03580 [Candidatus Doudnabacteria bacterium]